MGIRGLPGAGTPGTWAAHAFGDGGADHGRRRFTAAVARPVLATLALAAILLLANAATAGDASQPGGSDSGGPVMWLDADTGKLMRRASPEETAAEERGGAAEAGSAQAEAPVHGVITRIGPDGRVTYDCQRAETVR